VHHAFSGGLQPKARVFKTSKILAIEQGPKRLCLLVFKSLLYRTSRIAYSHLQPRTSSPGRNTSPTVEHIVVFVSVLLWLSWFYLVFKRLNKKWPTLRKVG
jgi:hypothetical protein